MFYEIATSPSIRAVIVDEKGVIQKIKNAQKQGTEAYRSYYCFDEEMLEHMKIRKTVKNYRGKYYLNDILFDIDKGQNTEEFCLGQTRNFIEELIEDWKVPKETIKFYFSGNKGWHIQIPDIFGFEPSNDLPAKVKATLSKYFPIADNIYDHARIIRLPGTVNSKSQLYKIELSYEEIMKLSISEIKRLAVKPKWVRRTEEENEEIKELLAGIVLMKNKIITPIKTELSLEKKGEARVDSGNILNCIQKIYNLGPLQGSRHTSMLLMTSAWKRNGLPKEAVKVLLKDWKSGLEPYEVERIVDDTWERSYNFSCKNSIMVKHCDPTCLFYRDRDVNVNPISAENLEKDFVKFAMSDFTHNSINLKDCYMLLDNFYIFPGEFVVLQGATGLNKSTLFQNWIINFPIPTLYLNFEMGSNLTYRRFAQIAHSLSKSDIINSTVDGKELFGAFNHLKSINQKFNIKELDRIIGEWKPKVIYVDTVEDMVVDGAKDVTAVTHVVAPELKRLAMKHDIIIMAIQHLSKMGSNNSTQTGIHGGKGASDIEQKADKVLRISGNRDNAIRTLETLKARDEHPFKIVLELNAETFRLTQLNVRN